MTKKQRKGTVREAVLVALPGTQRDLRTKTGASLAAVSRWVVYLRSTGEIHIGAWEPPIGPSGPPACVYHAGPGADVACSVRDLSPAEKVRRLDAMHRRQDVAAKRRRARELSEPARRDPFTAAFFGPAGRA